MFKNLYNITYIHFYSSYKKIKIEKNFVRLFLE